MSSGGAAGVSAARWPRAEHGLSGPIGISKGRTMDVGFASASLWNAYETTRRLADELDVRALAVRGGDGTIALVVVTDMGKVAIRDSVALRRAIGEKTGVRPSSVGIFATQNHSQPGPIKNVATRDDAFVAAAAQAVARLRPAEVAHVCVHPRPPINICRRVRVDGVGTFTCWYGHRDAGDGRADVAYFVKGSLANFRRGDWEQVRSRPPVDTDGGAADGDDDASATGEPSVKVPSPLYAPPAKDDAVQGLFFREPGGRAIGSLVRFATHPATANRKGSDWGSGDYPAYVRRRTEAAFGGVGMFMTGPCGDSCPVMRAKSLELAERVGSRVADAALAALPSAAWVADARVAVDAPSVQLPLKASFPRNVDEGARRLAELLEAFRARAAGVAGFAELKARSDEIESLGYFVRNTSARWSGLDQDAHHGATLRLNLFVLRMGDVAIAGLPGEPFNAYSVRLRRESIGDRLIVGEQCNGSVGYIPSADEFPHGSYEAAATLFDPRVEPLLVDGIRSGLARVRF
jgi:hypothetical protein